MPRAPRPTPRSRSQRGASSSLLVAIIAPMLLVLVGLVVDGGGQLAAVRQAEAVAAQAARAGADASATQLIGQQASVAAAARAGAEEHLRRARIAGTVTVTDGVVTVNTTVPYRTVFLGIIGQHQLVGHGTASARLAGSPPR